MQRYSAETKDDELAGLQMMKKYYAGLEIPDVGSMDGEGEKSLGEEDGDIEMAD